MSDYEIGVQSVVFQDYDLAGLVDELGETGISTLELWGYHLGPDDDEETVAEGTRMLEEAGIDVCGYGVFDLDDVGQAREHFAFAADIGADYVTANYPPARDDITEELIDLAEEFDLEVGVHNYSTVHHDDLSKVFSSVDDVREVLGEYDHPLLGVCIDTGHFLVMDETPDDVVPELGDRINSVHLKDTSDAEIEDIPGAGELDLGHFVDLLDEHADLDNPLVIEYELEDDVTAKLREAEAQVRNALDR
jgi:sugar phosphate isomerase/epimerase